MSDYTIVIDSREGLPLWTKSTKTQEIIVKKLDTGDYSIEKHENKFGIERKSLIDLFGTLGSGHKRFKKEIQRALDLDYFAIVIEGSHTSILEKSFDNAFRSKMNGYIINSILFTIHVKYGIPIFYTNGRIETKHVIKDIMNAYWKLHKPKVYTKDECGGV